VQDGDGFCGRRGSNTTRSIGQLVRGSDIAPFCMSLKKFTATYDKDGTASASAAILPIQRAERAGEARRTQVNHPLRSKDYGLYLLGTISPMFTIRDRAGSIQDVSAPFLPQDAAFSSQGA